MAFEFTSSKGVPFAVRIVKQGDRYGRSNVLTHKDDEPMVEFFDVTHPNVHADYEPGQPGQFVSRYNVSTLLGESKWSSGDLAKTGLCLDGGVPQWNVDAASMALVLAYVRGAIGR